jgi:hypothetical protein
MAVIAPTSMLGSGGRAVVETTLTSSDTLVYNPKAVLELRNPTAGALVPNIKGAAATTASLPGYGTVSLTSGYTMPSIAAGATAAVPLDSISEYLKGTITVTLGVGLVARLLEF